MDNTLIFQAILDFIKDLKNNFSTNHKINLYERLITNTPLDKINKHIDIFKNFCIPNKDNILNKDYNNFDPDIIYFSNNVYLNIKEIFKESDDLTKDIIWKHLLYIYYRIDPTTQVKDILKNNKNNESEFIESLINNLESNIDFKNNNPLEAIKSFVNSDIFTDLINKMKDGNLDIVKLMNLVQTLFLTISSNHNSPPSPPSSSRVADQNISSTNNISQSENNESLNTTMDNLGLGSLGNMRGLEGMGDLGNLGNIMTLMSSLIPTMSNNLNIEEVTDQDNKDIEN